MRNILSQLKYLHLSKACKALLRQNESYRDIFVNQRCFILGNGPSLNLYDLTVLSDEHVFCVNEFVRFDGIIDVAPNYYVLADPKFFDLSLHDDGDRQLIESFSKAFKSVRDMTLFVPLRARDSIEQYSWDANTQYFNPDSHLVFHPDTKQSYDFTKNIPGMQAVVHYAILLAVFMGFREIYLLGTDQTNIFGNLEAFMRPDAASEYAFNMTEKEREWKNTKLTTYTLYQTLIGYANIFKQYDELARYCENRNIIIRNCAPETLIQGIPKTSFLSLF